MTDEDFLGALECDDNGARFFNLDGEMIARWHPLTGLDIYRGPLERREGVAKTLAAAWGVEFCGEYLA